MSRTEKKRRKPRHANMNRTRPKAADRAKIITAGAAAAGTAAFWAKAAAEIWKAF